MSYNKERDHRLTIDILKKLLPRLKARASKLGLSIARYGKRVIEAEIRRGR